MLARRRAEHVLRQLHQEACADQHRPLIDVKSLAVGDTTLSATPHRGRDSRGDAAAVARERGGGEGTRRWRGVHGPAGGAGRVVVWEAFGARGARADEDEAAGALLQEEAEILASCSTPAGGQTERFPEKRMLDGGARHARRARARARTARSYAQVSYDWPMVMIASPPSTASGPTTACRDMVPC